MILIFIKTLIQMFMLKGQVMQENSSITSSMLPHMWSDIRSFYIPLTLILKYGDEPVLFRIILVIVGLLTFFILPQRILKVLLKKQKLPDFILKYNLVIILSVYSFLVHILTSLPKLFYVNSFSGETWGLLFGLPLILSFILYIYYSTKKKA
jgi:hypothetical protein